MVANTDEALTRTCQQLDAIVQDYTVAPYFLQRQGKGRHDWYIEFIKKPSDLNAFASLLDQNLQKLNSDYEAKRAKDIALENLRITDLPRGTFQAWLKSKGRLGGQHKIPRLANDRKYADQILQLL